MTHELSDLGLAITNTSETVPPSDTPTLQVLTGDRSDTANMQHYTLCPQKQNNAGQKPDEKDTSSLEQSSQRSGHWDGHDPDLEDVNARFANGLEPLAREDSVQVEVGVDSQTDPHQSTTVELERLSPKVEGGFLEMIRKKMLFVWGASEEDVPNILINNYDPTTLRFETDNHVTVNLGWARQFRTEADIREVARAQSSICRAWPRDRNVLRVKQFVLATDGKVPATEIPWNQVGQAYRNELATTCNGEHSQAIKYAGYEDTWHRWCFEAATTMPKVSVNTEASRSKSRGKIVYCASRGRSKGFEFIPLAVFAIALSDDQPFSVPDAGRLCFRLGSPLSYFSTDFRGGCHVGFEMSSAISIHWQIRYFTPSGGRIWHDTEKGIGCLRSERQNATIRQGPAGVHLQERRAQISFRVLETSPALFHILVLSDGALNPSHLSSGHEAQLSMSRYGIESEGKIIPVTHYLLEICRVLELSMGGWEKTLDSIDKLVHVNLNDFDDRDRIEDLMFDKSFTRSKDYFVALQLLRIVDQWIDEVIPSIEELRENRFLGRSAFCSTELNKNLDAADKYMRERAGAVQIRIRKKTEEINSLRDGLFNATSLRESTKAMALNQAIYVFTVVTVLFTPVSFLATFWALPFLNNPKEGNETVSEPPAFRNTFIVMPLLTYALVLGIAWHVGSENPNATLSRLLQAMWKELRQWPRTIWELRPRLRERKRTTSSNA